MKLNKEKVDEILKKSLSKNTPATWSELTPAQKAAAKRESRKILRELKEIDLEVYNIVKEEFDG